MEAEAYRTAWLLREQGQADGEDARPLPRRYCNSFRPVIVSKASSTVVSLPTNTFQTAHGIQALDQLHFDRKLADLKDAQNQKIESLKEQLNHLGDRGKLSNEREYGAIADLWGQFVDAFDSTERCVTQFIEHPDFNRLSDKEIDAFLNATDFTEDQKREFRSSSDKNKLATD